MKILAITNIYVQLKNLQCDGYFEHAEMYFYDDHKNINNLFHAIPKETSFYVDYWFLEYFGLYSQLHFSSESHIGLVCFYSIFYLVSLSGTLVNHSTN